jgi:hypothetical protein
MGNKAAVNRLDDQDGSKVVAKTALSTPGVLEAPDLFGGPSRTRTLDHTDDLNTQQLELWPDSQ